MWYRTYRIEPNIHIYIYIRATRNNTPMHTDPKFTTEKKTHANVLTYLTIRRRTRRCVIFKTTALTRHSTLLTHTSNARRIYI